MGHETRNLVCSKNGSLGYRILRLYGQPLLVILMCLWVMWFYASWRASVSLDIIHRGDRVIHYSFVKKTRCFAIFVSIIVCRQPILSALSDTLAGSFGVLYLCCEYFIITRELYMRDNSSLLILTSPLLLWPLLILGANCISSRILILILCVKKST